jgi:hypothetical protein
MMYDSESCRVSDKGIQQLCQIRQLSELRLGSSAEKADGDNNTFTVNGFKAVLDTLKTMPKLTVLEMQLNHVDNLAINGYGTYSVLYLGVGERGAQLIMQNLKNLTKLFIGKQWSDSENNSLGDLGATAIANNLKNLTTLYISKQWSDSGNNSVGDSGVTAIANNLKNLTTLGIGKQWSDSDNNSVGDSGATAIANNLKNLTTLGIGKQWSDSGNNKLSEECKKRIKQSLPKASI